MPFSIPLTPNMLENRPERKKNRTWLKDKHANFPFLNSLTQGKSFALACFVWVVIGPNRFSAISRGRCKVNQRGIDQFLKKNILKPHPFPPFFLFFLFLLFLFPSNSFPRWKTRVVNHINGNLITPNFAASCPPPPPLLQQQTKKGKQACVPARKRETLRT